MKIAQEVRNIERDPWVAISLEAEAKSTMGLTEYAVLYGQARIQEADTLRYNSIVYYRID